MLLVRLITRPAIALVKEVVILFGVPALWILKLGAAAGWLLAPFALLNVWIAAPGSPVRETSAMVTHFMPLVMAIILTLGVIGLRRLIRLCLNEGELVLT